MKKLFYTGKLHGLTGMGYIVHKTDSLIQPIVQDNSLFSVMIQESYEYM